MTADSPTGHEGARSKPPTMNDVARAAGVSLKTVSRVLNDEPFVSAGVRDQVQRAAEALHYRMNHAARGLRAGTAQLIVVAVNNPSRSYVESIHLGALAEAQRHNVQLVLDVFGDDPLADIARVLDTVSPIGVILTPPLSEHEGTRALLAERGVPTVLVAPGRAIPDALTVAMDDALATRQIVEMLIGLGHRRIGFIRGHPDHAATGIRDQAFRAALSDAGVVAEEALITQGWFDYASGLTCAEALLERVDRPTAIFASNDDMAAAVLSAAYRRHIAIPDQLSVVGFDDTQIAGIIAPALTTVRQPIAPMAAEAVRLLIQRRSIATTEDRAVLIRHEVVTRQSTGAPPG